MVNWEGPEEIVIVGFTWDEEKNLRNLEKHGVGFDEGATCFEAKRDKTFMRSNLKGEERWVLQGTSDMGRPLNVFFMLEQGEAGMTARIFSLRRR